jgi:hypothetical protein
MNWTLLVTLRLMPTSVWVCVFWWIGNIKAMNNSPWFPVCYILHPHEGISSHMMGNVVLGGTLPHPKLREFSWLMELQRSWGVFESPLGTLSVLQNADSRLAVLWNRTEMSSQLNLEQADEGKWRRRAIHPLITRSCQETGTVVTGLWRGRGKGLEGVLTQSEQSGETWWWCHSWPTAPGS